MKCPLCLEEVDVLVVREGTTVCGVCSEELYTIEMEKEYFEDLEREYLQDEYLQDDNYWEDGN